MDEHAITRTPGPERASTAACSRARRSPTFEPSPSSAVRAPIRVDATPTRREPSGAGFLEPGRGHPLAHRLGEGNERRQRTQHDREVGDQALLVEAQQVEALQLLLADARGEDQRVRALALELAH